MQDRDPPAPPSSHEVAGEDFLFHLYRGSELLQDNRVHDAKVELEQALRFQPSDPKGQDLLGIVYFRLGLYPRAIAIYEQLVQSHPEAIEPRVNLALSYLKTGQAAAARTVLERVVEQSPSHGRAWGYLGLAFQRLGDYERASHAFAAGGHDVMARRLSDMASTSVLGLSAASTPSLIPEAAEPREPPPPSRAALALEPIPGSAPGTTWTPLAPPELLAPQPVDATSPEPPLAAMMPPPARVPSATLAPPQALDMTPPSSVHVPTGSPPMPVGEALRSALLVYPRALPVAQHASGAVLVQAANGFATRMSVVRSMSLSGPAGEPLRRRVRGRVTDEPLGGAASPIFEIPGKAELLLAGEAGQPLVPLAIGEEPLYLREDALAAFEPTITYENGRLPVGDGDAIAMAQLRGPGTVVAILPPVRFAIEVVEGRAAMVRAAMVVAWSGRLLPRALLASEAPGSARGLVAFSGEGMVLLDGRA